MPPTTQRSANNHHHIIIRAKARIHKPKVFLASRATVAEALEIPH